jgi:heterodisulfide reductase subunit A
MAFIRPLARVAHHRVLVVGGGIAGIQAALDLAALGLPVTLTERGPSLGGLMAQLDKTFPTNDCAMCILSPRMLEIARHPLIEILTLTRVLQVQGKAGDFRALISRRPRYVDPERCSACGECTRVCPRQMPDPYNLGLKSTKAIHVPFPQAVPQAAYVAPEACRFFQDRKCRACLKVCDPKAINLNQAPEDRVLAVGAVILAPGARPAPAVDFPGYGHPDVVTSLEFERLLSATGPQAGRLLRPSDLTPPVRLAFIQCVGSRDTRPGSAAYCSSLCCLTSLKEALVAQELSGGHLESTVFYMDLRAQGKGAESYVEQAKSRGVRLIRSRVTAVSPRPGGGVSLRYTNGGGRPEEEPFDLAVLSVGLRPASHLPEWTARLGVALNEHGFIRASPLTPVLTGREGVLICGTAGSPMEIPEAVSTASAAAAAVSQLLTVSPRTWAPKSKLPEPGPEAEAAPRIGVFLCHCGTNIAKTVDLPKLAAGVRQLPGVVHVADELFACAVEATHRLRQTIRDSDLNRVVVAACTPLTHEALFREVLAAAGLNPGYFVLANIREHCAWVHQGEKAAALHKALNLIAMAVRRAAVVNPLRLQSFRVIPRALVLGGGVAGLSAALSLAEQGFHTYLIERSPYLGGLARQLFFTLEGPDPQEFLQELQAGAYSHPNVEVLTETQLIKVEGHVGQFRTRVRVKTPGGVKERRLEHGVILVATGGQAFHPQGRYLYGEEARVLTQWELEARVNAGDPELSRVRRLVMIQCVGSREPEHPYCSRLCCSQALKNALLLKDRYPLAQITVLYRDLRAYGFREGYYQQAKERGVEFIPFEMERPPRLAAPRRRPLTVGLWDGLLGQEVELAADLVVLSTGLEPAPGSEEVARQLRLPRTVGGFFLEAHQKLRPVDTVAEGIFLCGLAHYPKGLGETVAQALAAAGRAAGILYRTELFTGELIPLIAPGRCRRCLVCVEVCPYGAIGVTAAGPPEVHPEVCQGCGLCAAECPGEAIQLSRASDAEVLAQIEAALQESAPGSV